MPKPLLLEVVVKWLLEHAAALNFGVSVAQFASGLIIGFGLKPELVRKGKFGEWTFGLWTTQWVFFSFIYVVLLRYPYQRALLLFLLDIQSLLVLASAAIFMLAEPLRIGRTLITIAVLLFMFGVHNFFL